MSGTAKKVEVQGGSTAGGWEYHVLETPATVRFPVSSFSSANNFADGIIYHSAYIPADAIRQIKLPLDPNPRKPSPNTLVKTGIQVTLRSHPEFFHHYNNGITLAITSVTLHPSTASGTPDEIEVTFEVGDGICNGGHTFLAIENFGATSIDPSALVRCELVEIPASIRDRQQRILDLSRFRNMNNKIADETEANYLGFYDSFKEVLGSKSTAFKWYEGDTEAASDAANVKHLIRLIASVDPFWYSHHITGKRDNHQSAQNSTSTPHTQWFNAARSGGEKSLETFQSFMPLHLRVLDHIRYTMKENDYSSITKKWRSSRLWQYAKNKTDETPLIWARKGDPGYGKTGYDLPDRFQTLLLGCFRKNMWFSVDQNGDVEYVGTHSDPFLLWDKHGEALLQQLHSVYDRVGRNGGNITTFMSLPGNYNTQLATLQYGADSNLVDQPPNIVLNRTTGESYYRTEPSKATHHLEIINAKGTLKQVEMKSGSSSTLPCYIKR